MTDPQKQQLIAQMQKYLDGAKKHLNDAEKRPDGWGKSNSLMLCNDALNSCNAVQRRYFSMLKSYTIAVPVKFPNVKS